MTRCGSCRAAIHWARSAASGKPMPLDPEPVEVDRWRRGLFSLRETLEGPEAVAWRKAAVRPGGPLYVSHYSTCPDAERWRVGTTGSGNG